MLCLTSGDSASRSEIKFFVYVDMQYTRSLEQKRQSWPIEPLHLAEARGLMSSESPAHSDSLDTEVEPTQNL